MIKDYFVVILMFFISVTFLGGQGIDFKPISIKEGVELARSQDKNLFLYFGTTHCPYSQTMFTYLLNDETIGDFFNQNYINIGYGDSTTQDRVKWYYSDTRKQFHRLETELEAVLCNYFVWPNYFFINKQGEISFMNTGMRSPEQILEYAKMVNNGVSKRPLWFRVKFNNGVYPKNKKTFGMLTHCLNAYVKMDVPENIDYNNDSTFHLTDFTFEGHNLVNAQKDIEASLQYNEYYFNCFLASVIYYKSEQLEKAQRYAKKGLNDFPKHWFDSRKLPDQLMREILEYENE